MAEASAAVAAAQLLAFCKDPVRHRPRLTHGRESPPVGLHVFRFAQGKFPNGLLRELPAQERERLRKAANLFIRQICFWEGATHYQVLCVPPDARREAIKEHYHVLIALIHPDRQDADSEHWPPEAAHRVNLAYAVLSDEARRAEYDARLKRSAAERRVQAESEPAAPRTASLRLPVLGRFVAARMRLRKPALLVSAAVASLFYAFTWLAADVPTQYATLDSSTPLQVSIRFARNVFSSSDRPNYLADGGGLRASQSGAGDSPSRDEQESFLTPFWRMLSGSGSYEKPATAVPPSMAVLAPSGVTERPPRTPVADRREDTGSGPSTVLAPSGVIERPPRTPVADRREDTGSGPSPARSGSRPSQSPPDASPPATSPPFAVGVPLSGADTIELEILMASLVTYYERGDLEQFLALFDADSFNVLTAMALRADFQKFFRETRERRLKVQRLTWEARGETTRANGTALIEIEYRDPPERLERPTKVEVVVRVRDGKPKVAALSLFPRE